MVTSGTELQAAFAAAFGVPKKAVRLRVDSNCLDGWDAVHTITVTAGRLRLSVQNGSAAMFWVPGAT